MATNNTAEVTLNINSQNAKARLEELQHMVANLTSAINEAYKTGDKKAVKQLTTELRKTNKEISNIQKSSENLNVAMNSLSTATPKQLNAILRDINKELNSGNVKRGTEAWDAYNKKLIQVKAELAKINAEQKASLPLFDRVKAKWEKWQGVVVAGAAAAAGALTAISAMRKYRNEKDTALAGLQALTGLDDNSVAWLQEQAEKMSQAMDETGLRVTQSADEVLKAYMLVGSRKPELLGIKEDLNKVTIEAIRLSQAAGLNLEEAVNAVTISMNQFGASAERTEEFVNVLAAGSKFGAVAVDKINDAVLRSGVAASQAGLSIQDLVGAIETIGERGLEGNKAGTGLKTFFLKLATGADDTNPKIVGLSQALQNLADKHLSESEMVKQFGMEAYNVASIMVNSTEKFNYYKDAVSDTNVAFEQAARMGQTFSAKSAQLKNQLAELGQEIYKDIQPAISLFMSKSTVLLKLVYNIIQVFKKYGGAILGIIAPIAAYNVAIALSNALHSKGVVAIGQYIKALFSMNTITKTVTAAKYLLASATLLLSGNIKKATIAFKAFSRALALSPIGLLATAITAVIVGIVAWTKKEKELTQEQRNRKAIAEMNAEIEKKVNDETATEIARIEKLKAMIHDKNLAEKTRKKAIEDLKKILPSYNAELTREGDIIKENTKAIDDYIASLQEKARAKIIETELTEIIGQRMNAERAHETNLNKIEGLKQGRDEWNDYVRDWAQKENVTEKKAENWLRNNRHIISNSNLSETAKRFGMNQLINNPGKELGDLQEELKTTLQEIETLKAKENELLNYIKNLENKKVTKTQTTEEEEPGGNEGSTSDDERKKKLEELQLLAEQRKLQNDKDFAMQKKSLYEHDLEMLDIDNWLYRESLKLYSANEKEYTEYKKKIFELDAKYQKVKDENIKREQDILSKRLFTQYAKGLMTTDDYQTKLLQLEIEALRKRKELYKEGSIEYLDLDYQLEQKLIEQDKQRIAKSIKLMEDEYKEKENLLALSYAKGEVTERVYNEQQYQLELDHLEKMRDAYSEYTDDYIALQKKREELMASHQQKLAKQYADELKEFNKTYTTKVAYTEYNDSIESIDEMSANGDISQQDADRARVAISTKLMESEIKYANDTNNTIFDSYRARYEAIERLEEQGIITHEQAEKQKLESTKTMLNQINEIYEEAWSNIDTILTASSNLAQANADLETAKIEAEYDEKIEKAGKHSKAVEQLEKERDEKIKKIKTEANEKAMKIELAQAVASTASGAINAYSSAAAIPAIGYIMAPIAAAAAVAAGAVQIATIKKQHQAESIGYAQGGFTPLGKWNEEQGVVHSGEFVANRFAVANKEIRPALQLIDKAQKNNTIGSITAEDVTASLRTHTSPDVVRAVASRDTKQALPLASQQNNIALEATASAVNKTADVIKRLSEQLDEGITAYATVSGRNGIDEQTKKYNRLISNAK